MLSNQLTFVTVKTGKIEFTNEFKKVGNPNFKSKWKGLETKPLRIPMDYKDKVIEFCNRLYNGKNEEIGKTEVKPSSSVTLSTVTELSLDQIHCDPKRFQYKILSNGKTGSTGSLRGIKTFNPDLAGLVLVWKDTQDGLTYIINGHNRLELAKRCNVEKIAVRFIKAIDDKEARIIGAMANIAEGNGTPLDASKLFRESKRTKEDLRSYGVKLSNAIAEKGLKLANLNDYLYEKVYRGELSLDYGVAIGALDKGDPQDKFYQLLQKEKRTITKEVLTELTAIVENSLQSESSSVTLFGLDSFTESLALEKAELSSYIEKRLKTDKRLFRVVSNENNANILSLGNNQIDTQTSKERFNSSKNAIELFKQFKLSSGKLSDCLNNYAKRLKDGKNSIKVKQDCYESITELLVVSNLFSL